VVGVLQNSPVAVVQDLLGWTAPICVALYIYAQREHVHELLGSFRSSFLYGTLLMSLYGLYQFLFLAPWDAFWMETSALTSIGLPEPMQVRVFSTMNSPQPLADFLTCGIFLSMTSTRRIRFLVIPLALLVTGLTMSRSAWICGLVGIIVLALSFTARQRNQLAFLLLLFVVLVGAALQIPEANQLLTRRLESFSNLHQDESVNERVASQRQAIEAFKSSPFGLGMGVGSHARSDGPTYGVPPQSIEIADNGVEQILLSFGWFGSIIFLIGFGGAVFSCLRFPRDRELISLKALLVGMIFQIPVMGVFPGANGFLLWSAIGLCSSWKDSPPVVSHERTSRATENWSPKLMRES
jgi:O-antigen ligase